MCVCAKNSISLATTSIVFREILLRVVAFLLKFRAREF